MIRLKLNCKLREAMSFDDVSYAQRFAEEWEMLKNGDDFKKLFIFLINKIINLEK